MHCPPEGAISDASDEDKEEADEAVADKEEESDDEQSAAHVSTPSRVLNAALRKSWQTEFSWLEFVTDCDTGHVTGMRCSVCCAANLKRRDSCTSVFVKSEGCGTLRHKKLVKHAKDALHSLAERVASAQPQTKTKTLDDMLPSQRKSIESKLRLVYWIGQEDVALDKFRSLHALCVRLGAPHLDAFADANAQYTSSTSVSGMLTALSEVIERGIKVELVVVAVAESLSVLRLSCVRPTSLV